MNGALSRHTVYRGRLCPFWQAKASLACNVCNSNGRDHLKGNIIYTRLRACLVISIQNMLFPLSVIQYPFRPRMFGLNIIKPVGGEKGLLKIICL